MLREFAACVEMSKEDALSEEGRGVKGEDVVLWAKFALFSKFPGAVSWGTAEISSVSRSICKFSAFSGSPE